MVSQQKIEMVKTLTKVIEETDVVGIAGIHGIPGIQMNIIRRKLGNDAKMIVTKNRYLARALKNVAIKKKNIDMLISYISDQSALILGYTDPFKLSKIIESSKTKGAAKGGEIAEDDIIVYEGQTSFRPGPIVSDLQKVGIPAAIERGKVVIKKTQKLVSKGEVIKRDLAQMLTKLEIYPVTIGVDLRAIYEKGIVYQKDVLLINAEQTVANLKLATEYATNLALNAKYFTDETVSILLAMAYKEAIALGVTLEIYTAATIVPILEKAHLQMLTLKNIINTKKGG